MIITCELLCSYFLLLSFMPKKLVRSLLFLFIIIKTTFRITTAATRAEKNADSFMPLGNSNPLKLKKIRGKREENRVVQVEIIKTHGNEHF